MKYLTHIDYIYTVYKEKSFSKAAEKLYISQPSLSLTIKKIEKEIGFDIFMRIGKNTVPTPLGEKYIAAIEEILQRCNLLDKEIDDILKLKQGIITIGTTTFVASYIIPEILKEFKDKYPNIVFNIIVEHSPVLEKKLEKREVDFIIDNTTSFSEQYEYHPLLNEEIFIGVPKNSIINEAIGGKRTISLSELEKENFILLKKGNKMRQIAEKIFSEASISPNVCMEFDQLQTSISYANNGFGICFISDIALQSEKCNNLNLYSIESKFNSRTLYIIKSKNQYTSNACRALIEHFQNHFKL